jgi:hypothetical protein
MTYSPTITTAAPATLTRNELFENFLHLPVPGTDLVMSDIFKGFETARLDEVFRHAMVDCSGEDSADNPEKILEMTLEEFDGIERNLQEIWSSLRFFEDQLRVDVDDDTSDDRFSVPIDVRDRLYWNALSIYAKLSALAVISTGDNATRLNEFAEKARILSLKGTEMFAHFTGSISREKLKARLEEIAGRDANLLEVFRKAHDARALKDDQRYAA